MAIIEKKYRVEINHIGKSNLITNSGILTILEDIGCFHSDLAGYGINDIPTKNVSWVLLAWDVKILKRSKYGSCLTVKTWARSINKITTYRDFEVFDEEGNSVCIATSKWALVNVSLNRATRVTDEIINAYEPENINILNIDEIGKLDEPKTYISEFTYKVQRRDIDINNHMHNLHYLSLAYEALPEDIYNLPEFDNIEIMYKKGIKLNDTIKCLYSYENDCHFVTIKSEDEKFLHAIVKLY